jgi:hypothetical protein
VTDSHPDTIGDLGRKERELGVGMGRFLKGSLFGWVEHAFFMSKQAYPPGKTSI